MNLFYVFKFDRAGQTLDPYQLPVQPGQDFQCWSVFRKPQNSPCQRLSQWCLFLMPRASKVFCSIKKVQCWRRVAPLQLIRTPFPKHYEWVQRLHRGYLTGHCLLTYYPWKREFQPQEHPTFSSSGWLFSIPGCISVWERSLLSIHPGANLTHTSAQVPPDLSRHGHGLHKRGHVLYCCTWLCHQCLRAQGLWR